MKMHGVLAAVGERKRSVAAPDPEVSAKATRRRLTEAYRLSIMEQAERCEAPGQIGQSLLDRNEEAMRSRVQ